jgi:uncharacterized membrane protein
MSARIHPYVVHFAVGLIVTSVILFVIGALFRRRAWSAGVLTAARWNLWIGAAFALASIGAGFLDYISAHCDRQMIEATILHRRAGAVTWWSSLIAGIAVWRTRHRPPGPFLLAGLLFVGLAAITAARLGTGLAYGQGLGVERPWPADTPGCFELERQEKQG